MLPSVLATDRDASAHLSREPARSARTCGPDDNMPLAVRGGV